MNAEKGPVSRTRMQGHVDQPSRGVRRIIDPASARINSPLMRGDESETIVIQTGFLRAIAVMRVIINHHDALHSSYQGFLRSNGNVIKDAKAHRTMRFGMMSRWAYNRKCILRILV